MCDQQSLRSACACAQSDRGLCLSLECYVTIGLLPVLGVAWVLSRGGCAGSSGSARVGMPHCWKSHVTALNSIIPSVCTFVP